MRLKLKNWVIKPELVFVFLAVFFGMLSVVLMPILEVPDENQHFQVEYAIFSSNKKAPDDLVLSEAIVLSAIQKDSYRNYFTETTSAERDGIAVNTKLRVFDGNTKASVFDIMRLPQAMGILAGRLIYPSIGFMVLMGRLATLAIYITVMYLIIKNVRHGKFVFVFIACLPIAIQQAASLSYDAINMLAIFAWVAFIINIYTQKSLISRKQLIMGLLLVILLLLTKANNVLLLALVLALPVRHITESTVYKAVHASKFWRLIKYLASIIVGIAIFAILYLMSRRILAGQDFDLHQLGNVLMNTFIWEHLELIDVTVSGMVGQFSNYYYHLPMWSVVIAFVVLAIVMLYEKIPKVSKRFALTSLLLFISSILLITVGMYYGWALNPVRLGPGAVVADGIQGRYFMPLLILLFPFFAYLQNYLKIVTKDRSTIPIIVTSSSVFLLSFYVIQTWHYFWK